VTYGWRRISWGLHGGQLLSTSSAPFAEDGEPARIASGCEDLCVQRRRTDDLDAREISQEPTDGAGLLHDDEDAPRLPIPPAAHFPAPGTDVSSVFRAFHVGHEPELIKDFQPLASRAAIRGERLDAVLDHDRERDVLREPVSPRSDHPGILQGRKRRVAGEPPLMFVDLLRPCLVGPRRMSTTPADGSRRLCSGHRARRRGTRDTPCPLPDHRTEWRIPAPIPGPYACRRLA